MDIGKLNRRIQVITYGASTLTATGGTIKGAPTAVDTWAGVSQLSQSETLANGLKLGQANYRMTLRYDKPITQRNEIVYNDQIYRIISIIDKNEALRVVTILCNVRTN